MDDVEGMLQYLDEVITLLRQYGIDFWADWMQRGRDLIAQHDGYGLCVVLGAYGGMGSFTDVYICPINGHPITEDEVKPVNEHLRRLQNRIFVLARNFQRELDRAP